MKAIECPLCEEKIRCTQIVDLTSYDEDGKPCHAKCKDKGLKGSS